jgi:hypothetical protein
MKCTVLPTIAVAIATMVPRTFAFAPNRSTQVKVSLPNNLLRSATAQRKHMPIYSPTTLQMGYNLPPSPKGPLDELKTILPTIGTGILVAFFFASPLGTAFFAIFNSLFVLALLTPFIIFVGFQVWSALYTVEAPCPSCGQLPVRALKNGEPTVCLNCGAFSRANANGDGLELCNNPNDIMNEGSLFDALFGGGMMGGINDSFGNVDIMDSRSPSSSEQQKQSVKRQGTIIDVEVERD